MTAKRVLAVPMEGDRGFVKVHLPNGMIVIAEPVEKREDFEWREEDHPRGKTSDKSTPGSFAPKGVREMPPIKGKIDKQLADELAAYHDKRRTIVAKARQEVEAVIKAHTAQGDLFGNEDVMWDDKLLQDVGMWLSAAWNDLEAGVGHGDNAPFASGAEMVYAVAPELMTLLTEGSVEDVGRTLAVLMLDDVLGSAMHDERNGLIYRLMAETSLERRDDARDIGRAYAENMLRIKSERAQLAIDSDPDYTEPLGRYIWGTDMAREGWRVAYGMHHVAKTFDRANYFATGVYEVAQREWLAENLNDTGYKDEARAVLEGQYGTYGEHFSVDEDWREYGIDNDIARSIQEYGMHLYTTNHSMAAAGLLAGWAHNYDTPENSMIRRYAAELFGTPNNDYWNGDHDGSIMYDPEAVRNGVQYIKDFTDSWMDANWGVGWDNRNIDVFRGVRDDRTVYEPSAVDPWSADVGTAHKFGQWMGNKAGIENYTVLQATVKADDILFMSEPAQMLGFPMDDGLVGKQEIAVLARAFETNGAKIHAAHFVQGVDAPDLEDYGNYYELLWPDEGPDLE